MSLILLVVKNQRKYSYLQVIFCIDHTATSHPLLQQHSLIIHKEDKQSVPQFLWIMALDGSVLGLLWIEKVHPGLICCSSIVQKHLSHQIIMLQECPGTLHSPVFCPKQTGHPSCWYCGHLELLQQYLMNHKPDTPSSSGIVLTAILLSHLMRACTQYLLLIADVDGRQNVMSHISMLN